MSATARNGRVWTASGTTDVWTTKLRYDGGFESPILNITQDLVPDQGAESSSSDDGEKGKEKGKCKKD